MTSAGRPSSRRSRSPAESSPSPPPLLEYKLAAFAYFRPQRHEWTHIPYYMVYAMGIVPSLIATLGLARHGRGIWRDARHRDGVVISCVTAVGVVTALFCLVPQDRNYLMPLFPFLFILLGRYVSRRWLTVFVVFALACGFVKIELKDNTVSNTVHMRPHLAYGPVLGKYRHLRQQMVLRARLAPYLRATFDPDEKGVLVSGFVLGLAQLVDNADFTRVSVPQIGTDVYALVGSETLVMSETADAAAYAHLRAAGYRLVFVEGALRYSHNAFGFEIDPHGEEIVPVVRILDQTGNSTDSRGRKP